ncbi:hypothetical protein [Croceicoccus sp. YJ47]|uniref:hypothetical protein n=1 Tax=Croceicoccus sp. YJ47 TaxID=2798724 RepID=UPI001920F413|nr:hypothetical protein [Croceicoccus sp. YJ47]QQN73148.1 hypothetical protein JD971_09725 [Croceicoccus sp. YJ47]
MTKLRAPLTFELALTKIAGTIGWAGAAAILGQSERTIRNWSDPDAAAGIRLDAAELLDIAFQEAGGKGAPFLECYATRLKSALSNSMGSAEAIAEAVANAAKEGGEAISAAITAASPGASHTDYVNAIREIEEAIEAKTNTLAAIRARLNSEQTLSVEEGTAS